MGTNRKKKKKMIRIKKYLNTAPIAESYNLKLFSNTKKSEFKGATRPYIRLLEAGGVYWPSRINLLDNKQIHVGT